MFAAIGRFGPYLRIGKVFVSLKADDGDEPMTVTEPRAIELIEAHLEAKAKAQINTFESEKGEIHVLEGRWGPYIKFGKKNFKIPKDKEAKDLTVEDCIELIENPIKPTRGKKAVKKTAKKTVKKKK